MAHFSIKVVSDNVCPFCYLGKKRLERAIELYRKAIPDGKSDTFAITWSAFYLDPDAPKVGVPVVEKMAQKLGADRLDAINARLGQMGQAEGINFTHRGLVGHTRDSHRLVKLGKTKGSEMENRVISELFRSYFEEGGDITSHDMLVAAGEKAGIDRDEVRQWLSSDAGGKEVDQEVQEAVRAGVHGVPNFTINGKYKISGAQDVQAFVEAFTQAKAVN